MSKASKYAGIINEDIVNVVRYVMSVVRYVMSVVSRHMGPFG